MPRLIVALFMALVPMLKDLFFKILAGLGASFVSYEALSLSTDAILKYFQNAYGIYTPDILNMFALAGIPEALNIIFGGFSFSFGIWSSYRVLKFLK
ncbi:DUF2523 domain-containing protein [Neisseria meningitidis]|uniref:DUF2523 domain-containing protein n=1 Tax=Neisseria meningitidis TaxID=487 RepID=UPI0006E54A34|nr:DUF2523 domain-containing protein [Neisseria meningitidis]KQB44706.1 hypothetical protein LD08_05755 [Neisseria meningitidis]